MVLNGKCVTVVASTGLDFRAFHLLTSTASHDLKETRSLIYCFLQGLRGRFPVNKLNPKNYRISIYSPAKALFILLTAQNFPHILQVSL